MSSTTTRQEPARARRRAPRRKRDDRRLLLLETTVELIGREGLDAVNHRLVAQHAGVPLGSTTYWFRSRDEMVTEALVHFAREETAALAERLAAVPPASIDTRAGAAVDALTALITPQLGRERWRTVAQYALLSEAARRPELRPVVQEWNEAWWGALERLFGELGLAAGRIEARMLLAFLDGLLMQQLATPDEDFEERLLRPMLQAWLERLPAAGRR
jgi:TetR/AcrR family transcriptional regulator, regulator of biofilm formation and stress response